LISIYISIIYLSRSLKARFQISSPHEKGWCVSDDLLEIPWILRGLEKLLLMFSNC